MPSTRCCVTSCSNTHKKTRIISGSLKVSYYSFPKDAQLRKTWIFNCKKGSDFNPSTSQVCSEHFTQDSFEDDVEARIMGLIRPRKLKQEAIPTEKLTNTPTSQIKKEAAESRHARLEESRSKQTVMELYKDIKKEEDFEITEDIKPFDVPPNLVCSTCKNLSVSVFINEKKILEEQVKDLKEEVKKLKKEIENRCKEKIVVVRSKSKEEADLKDALKRVFTDEQINLLMNKKRRAAWSVEDMRRAFTLRCFSKRAYLFTKNRLNIPLPGISTLQLWASRKQRDFLRSHNLIPS